MTSAELMEYIEAGNEIICTVHASETCDQPNGPTWNGDGWGHDDELERVECQSCYEVLMS